MKEYGPNVTLDAPAWIHESVALFGKIHVSRGASLWPHVVIRSEAHAITIGAYSNIQEFSMIHVGLKSGTRIGDYCTISHQAVLQGCTIGNNCLIGTRATIMENVTIGDNCIVAPHTFIQEGTTIPEDCVVLGHPAKVVRKQSNALSNRIQAMLHNENAMAYADGNHRRLSAPDFQQKALTWLQGMKGETPSPPPEVAEDETPRTAISVASISAEPVLPESPPPVQEPIAQPVSPPADPAPPEKSDAAPEITLPDLDFGAVGAETPVSPAPAEPDTSQDIPDFGDPFADIELDDAGETTEPPDSGNKTGIEMVDFDFELEDVVEKKPGPTTEST